MRKELCNPTLNLFKGLINDNQTIINDSTRNSLLSSQPILSATQPPAQSQNSDNKPYFLSLLKLLKDKDKAFSLLKHNLSLTKEVVENLTFKNTLNQYTTYHIPAGSHELIKSKMQKLTKNFLTLEAALEDAYFEKNVTFLNNIEMFCDRSYIKSEI